MRDLQRHPITTAEVIACLDQLALADEQGIGDMRPLLLQTAARIIIAAEIIMLHGDSRAAGILRAAFK